MQNDNKHNNNGQLGKMDDSIDVMLYGEETPERARLQMQLDRRNARRGLSINKAK